MQNQDIDRNMEQMLANPLQSNLQFQTLMETILRQHLQIFQGHTHRFMDKFKQTDEKQTSCMKAEQFEKFLSQLPISETMLSAMWTRLRARSQNMVNDNTVTYSECFDLFLGQLDYGQSFADSTDTQSVEGLTIFQILNK